MSTTPTPSTPATTDGGALPPISVIIPSRNPRLDVFEMTLAALRAQTLPPDEWELIVVDNDSEPPLATLIDLSWHPRARIVVEKTRGMLPCRSRGLRESRGEVVVSVDDDNILAPDYLAAALTLGRERPRLGVWGGRIVADFEGTPPPWLFQFAHHLAICEIDRPTWSSFVDDRSIPYGASMCIRRAVVDAFIERLDAEKITRYGRTYGTALDSSIVGVGGEDQLISYTATMIGYSVGRFPELQMRHRIYSKRYEPKYFLKMVRGNAHGALLVQLHHGNCPRYRTSLLWPILKSLGILLQRRGMVRRVMLAEVRGEFDALQENRRRGAPAPVHMPKTSYPAQIPAAPPLPAAGDLSVVAASFSSGIKHEQRP